MVLNVFSECFSKYVHRLQGAPLSAIILGACNWLVGAHLRKLGATRLIACNISPEAKRAALRYRPVLYDDYIICDSIGPFSRAFHHVAKSRNQRLDHRRNPWFADIPKEAFLAAIGFLKTGALIAFNLKDQL